MTHSLIVLAQFGGGGPLGTLLLPVAIIAMMYFLMIRPQQKQLKAHRELLAGLKKGDRVVTQSGLIGRIDAITDKDLRLEIAAGVKVQMLKSAIQGRVQADEPAILAPKAEDKEEK